MSFKVKIIIDGEEHNVLSYSFNLSKGSDTNGKPKTKTVLHKLSVKLESNNKTDLMSWMISTNQTKQIELHILARQGEKTRILYFADTNLVGLNTTFSATGNTPMTDNLQMTAGGLNTNDSSVEYSAYWRTTFPQQEVKQTTRENTEEEIVDCYLTDLENNENPDLEVEKEIYLVIKTENLIGQTKDIDIAHFGETFSYNDEIVEDNTLSGFYISKDLHKVKLKIVKSQDQINSLED